MAQISATPFEKPGQTNKTKPISTGGKWRMTEADAAHQAPTMATAGKKASRPRCRFFDTPKGCREGDACRFSHERRESTSTRATQRPHYKGTNSDNHPVLSDGSGSAGRPSPTSTANIHEFASPPKSNKRPNNGNRGQAAAHQAALKPPSQSDDKDETIVEEYEPSDNSGSEATRPDRDERAQLPQAPKPTGKQKAKSKSEKSQRRDSAQHGCTFITEQKNKPPTDIQAQSEQPKKKTKAKRCKYGSRCIYKNKTCKFLHPEESASKSTSSVQPPEPEPKPEAKPVPKPQEPIPEQLESNAVAMTVVGITDNEKSTESEKKQPKKRKKCRFGARCRNKRCYFEHPEGSRKPAAASSSMQAEKDVEKLVHLRELEQKVQQRVQQMRTVKVLEEWKDRTEERRKRVEMLLLKMKQKKVLDALQRWKQHTEEQKERTKQLEAKLTEFERRRQHRLLSASLRRWMEWMQEPEQKARALAKKRSDILQAQKDARKKNQEEKAKKHELFLKEQREKEQERVGYWAKEREHEVEYRGYLVELVAAEFVRQNQDTTVANLGHLTAERLKADPDAMRFLEERCAQAYRELYPNMIQKPVSVVDFNKKAHHNRTGIVHFWDAQKKKYSVGLDTKKKKNAEVVFIKPENLVPQEQTHPRGKVEANKKGNKQQGQQGECKLCVKALFMNLDLSTEVSTSDLEMMKEASDLDSFLQRLMGKRDSSDRLARQLEEQRKRQEEEDRRLRAEERARENEEWEREKRRRDEQKREYADWKKEYKREQRNRARNAAHFASFFFGGESPFGRQCNCPRCQMGGEYGFFPGGIPPFWFFADDEYFNEDDSSDTDYDDFESEQERMEAIQKSAGLLGVAVDASPAEVKSAYRRLALTFHPDKYDPEKTNGMSKEEGQEHFQHIANAYEVLKHHHAK